MLFCGVSVRTTLGKNVVITPVADMDIKIIYYIYNFIKLYTYEGLLTILVTLWHLKNFQAFKT